MLAQIIQHKQKLKSETPEACSFCQSTTKPLIKSLYTEDTICVKCLDRFSKLIHEDEPLA